MTATAKVFITGHSQAIRLPKAYRVDVEEMWISRNEVTGELTLRPKDSGQLRQQRLAALMAAVTEAPLPENFLSESQRRNAPPVAPFAQPVMAAARKVPAKRNAKPKGRA
ncbi:MAG: hypothetical protein IT467_00070 [Dokdonella sp.]|uniref:antitoxin n=1 Tax=Dokdonella sp. TaxID=2291710 RepID=UPI0025BD3491|nr:hypothetical protein [Dokdonella sp.]MBZ0221825.1 hypothetical protein [Dokdonella sp.]MCC7254310.1 hypothetical protein [Dokdonella sp.]